MKSASLSKVLSRAVVLAAAMGSSSGAQSPNPSAITNSIEFAASSSDNLFHVHGGDSPFMREMRERLKDPQLRAELRAERRANIDDNHYGVAQTLELSDATYQKLLDLVTDQRMAQLDDFHLRTDSPPVRKGFDDDVHARAQRQNVEIDALRELLGQQKLERYQAMQASLGYRLQVRDIDVRLSTPDKLDATQREQLIELLYEHSMRDIEQRRSLMSMHRSRFGLQQGTPLTGMPSPEELQRSSLLMSIEHSEQLWRRMPAVNQQLREQAAAFLTPSQLAMLQRVHEESEAASKQRIEQMRLQAGLSPTIPDRAEMPEEPLATVPGRVKLSIKFTVNQGKPKYFTEVVTSGRPVSFQLEETLFAEATTRLFENDMFNLNVAYYEVGSSGKRLLGNLGQAGSIVREPLDHPSRSLDGGGGATIVSGNKAYAVQINSVVEPL